MSRVVFEGVAKVYPDGTRAVDDLNLEISDGEFMVLVGPSGCGKTTALRMLAGLEDISEGTVRIGDRAVNDMPPRDRDIAMVFQSYALYPHLSVRDNIAFGLKLRGEDKDVITKRVDEAARILGLEGFLDRKPKALSGGQRQRVAMGRAIVRQPAAFLMDEPLSNLDAKLRVQMRAEIARLQDDLETTTVYVTHDQIEAMTMGDRVAVMRKGELQQVAPPQELYDRPVNLFVGGFIGSPAMNLLEGRLDGDDGGMTVKLGSQELGLSPETVAARPDLRRFKGRNVVVGIRPEDIEDASLREALGSELMVHFLVDAPAALTEDIKELQRDSGEGDGGINGPDEAHDETTIVGRFSPRSRVRSGDTVEAAVNTANLHFFDPETGLGIYGNQAGDRA